MNVLRGAERLLARLGVIWQMEVDPALLQSASTDTRELLELLARHFTHAIDLGTGAERPASALSEALACLGTSQHKTDVLLYRIGAA